MPRITSALACVLLLITSIGLRAESLYSPYAEDGYPTRVMWGDTHLHTTLSLDARTAGVTVDVETAYRFARGETVTATSGQPARLSRPLDFLVITDHSDGFGVVDEVIKGNPELLAHPELQELHDNYHGGDERFAKAMDYISRALLEGDMGAMANRELLRSNWERYVETADRFNDPGRFTALIGYEWTPLVAGDKLHRNVLYRGAAATARKLLPFTATESIHPEALWQWMQQFEDETGDRVLALAHNGNLSNGKMFPVETNPSTGLSIDAEYVKTRARWEPLFEVTQIKGDSESHPYLSPTDEFADFERWDRANTTFTAPKDPNMLQYEYAREALKNGLKLERSLGSNPYRFGMVGSTDSHTGLSTAGEPNFFGKMAFQEPRPGRSSEPMAPSDKPTWQNWETSASGYAAVWATENTREAIWDAMARREVYATSGPRMTVRFFGSWQFTEDEADLHDLPATGYGKGVPMGGSLHYDEGQGAPTFLVAALKDPLSGHLDRIQIIKGWLDREGVTHEEIFNVAWSDAHRRKLNSDGTLPLVGNTVDVANASWTNSIGEAELTGFWRDPEFDSSQPAVYYARVIEIPTPRWIVYDAKHFGVELPRDARTVLQERAYTSPIWYTPAGK